MEKAKLFSKVAGVGVFKTRYGWLVGLIAFIVVDFQITPTIFACRKPNILSNKLYPLHVFDRGSEFILLMDHSVKRSFELHIHG